MSVPSNRYSELLAQIPKGNFYVRDGIVLPFRDNPWQLQLTTPLPNSVYEFYLDGVPQGQVATDSSGNVALNVILPRGQHTLTLTSEAAPTQPLTTYATITDYAVWLAAYSDVFNGIDGGITAVQDNTYLATATADQIDAIWGQRVGLTNTVQYSVDAYRDLLQQIRQAYRRFGASYAGVNLATSGITTTTPLVMARQSQGPRWILGSDRTLGNNSFSQWTKYTTSVLTNLNSAGGNFSVQSLSGDMPNGTGSLVFTPQHISGPLHVPALLTWTAPDGFTISTELQLAYGQPYLPGPYTITPYNPKARLVSLPGPFTMPSGAQSASITFSMDGNTPITVAVGGGGASIAATTIANAIVAAFPHYPAYAGYGVTNVAADTSGRLEFTSKFTPNEGVNQGQIVIYPSPLVPATVGGTPSIPSQDASQAIFGLPWAYTTSTSGLSPGTTVIPVASMVNFTVPTPDAPLTLLFNRNQPTILVVEPFEAQAIGVSGSSFILDSPGLANFIYVGSSVEVAGQLPYAIAPPVQPVTPACGDQIVISGTNTNFPATTKTDSVTVGGNGAPDGWLLTNATALITDGGFFTYYSLLLTATSSSDSIFSSVQNQSVSEYVGYTLDLAFWCKLNQEVIRQPNPVAGAIFTATLPAQTVVAGISFDGVTWAEGTPVTLTNTNTLLPFEVTSSVVIPPGATVPTIRLRWISPSPPVSIYVERVHLKVNLIDATFLGDETIPRSEQRSKLGYYMYIWSPDQLSPAEYAMLGCPPSPTSLGLPAPAVGSGESGFDIPATVTPTVPFSGLTIETASFQTPVGNASLIFTAGSPPTIAYQVPGDSSPGLPVSLPTSGFYTIQGASAFSLYVDVDVAELPTVNTTQLLTIGFIQGLIQTTGADCVTLEPFDVSYYGNLLTSNIAGVFTEVDFLNGAMTNMTIVLRSPARFTHLEPTEVSQIVGEDISFSGTSPYVAGLAEISDQNQANAILYEGGVPVPNNLWSYSGPQQITLSYIPLSVQYTLDYNTLIQFTSGAIDTGINYADYAWYIDFYAYMRQEVAIYSTSVTYGVVFNANFQASLQESSDQDQSNSTLQADNGQTITTVPISSWSYSDPNTIQINSAAFDPTAVYQFTYNAQSPHPAFGPTITVNYHGASSPAALAAVPYVEVQQNQPISNVNRYHQFQVTFTGVRDLRDFRLQSVLVKGLGLYTGLPVPGLPDTYA
jgi:hypothetical protein